MTSHKDSNRLPSLGTLLNKSSSFYKEATSYVLMQDSSYHYFQLICEEYIHPLKTNVFSMLNHAVPLCLNGKGEIVGSNLSMRPQVANQYMELFEAWKINNYEDSSAIAQYLQQNLFLGLPIVQGMLDYESNLGLTSENKNKAWFKDFNQRWNKHLNHIYHYFEVQYLEALEQYQVDGLTFEESEQVVSNWISPIVWDYACPILIPENIPTEEYFKQMFYIPSKSVKDVKRLLKKNFPNKGKQ